jgi:hypothetical protein
MKNKYPDITPHLVYPDDPEYVAAATKYWIALHDSWAKTAEKIQAEVWENVIRDKT